MEQPARLRNLLTAVIFVFRRKTEPKCNGFCEAKIGEEFAPKPANYFVFLIKYFIIIKNRIVRNNIITIKPIGLNKNRL